jgi:two-component system sensor histidine kinase ChvG
MLSTLADIYQTSGALREVGNGNGASETPVEAQPVRIELDVPNGERIMANALEGRLVQVFRNLIANAQSFSPPGGTIILRARKNSTEAIVEVADQGPGIPQDKEEAIFQRFYSERPAGEAFGTHSGLGLSISRQIIHAHGGSLEASNRVGPDGQVIGALFTTRLPLAEAA